MKFALPPVISECFDAYRNKFNARSKYDGNNLVVGRLWWKTEKVLWLYATSNEESYEGSQTQIGILKDGTVVWGYQSHCSCNGYEDDKKFNPYDPSLSEKTYELEKVDPSLFLIIQERIDLIKASGLKDEVLP